ncbi:MAG TPA: LacI family DNA-binding transcriptional regulator [Armatimonadota bacterium]|jgi:DNA-binding LacI/PurR family transcriptional regulator
MTSLRKIAELAGVSRMTVSRALNNHPHVRPEMAERIRELAEICHYRPNRLTQSLFSGKSQTIGCVVPSLDSTYFDRILNGVVETAYAQSYQVMIIQTHQNMQLVRAALQAFVDRRVDGVLLAHAMMFDVPSRSLLELRSNGISALSIDASSMHGMVDAVRTDEKGQAQLAVDHLYQQGHRRIACLMPKGDHRQSSMRTLALRDALERRQLPADALLEVNAHNPLEAMPWGEWMRALFAFVPTPTAVICFNDEFAAPLLREMVLAGLHVPQDVSVLGFGNLCYGPFLVPALTTVEQHPEKIGQLAVERLLEIIEQAADPMEEDRPHKAHALLVPPTLIERESCMPPPKHKVVLPWAR